MVTFTATRWPLPIAMERVDWGYGTSLVMIPDTGSVLLSLPPGRRPRWCVADLVTGQLTRGTGMPGHLRAAAFPAPGSADDRPWILGTHGLGRLELKPKATVTDVVRKGIGTYPSNLLPLGPDLLGIGHRRGRSLLLVSTAAGTPVTRLRVAGPAVAYRLPDERIRVLGPHYAEATDIEPARRAVVARHPMPYGKDVHHLDGVVTALLGDRADYERVDGVWDVLPQRVAVLDPGTLRIRAQAPAPPDAVEVLGTDRHGGAVLATHHGLVLLDPATLAATASYHLPKRIRGAALRPGHNLACVLGGDENDDALYTITW